MFDIGRPDLDWTQLAMGMGVPAVRPDSLDSFSNALLAGLEGDGPTLIEVCL
jgi:acetolactate synthase-1/2/3 large subunit